MHPRAQVYRGPKPKNEISRLRQLASHREQAFYEVLTLGTCAKTIKRRADKWKDAQDALKRVLGRRARG